MPTFLGPDSVRLLDGPFARSRDLNDTWLLALDPDRLLNGFYANAGLPPRGDAYGGWERASLAGHSLGHYLSAVARRAASGDRRFVERKDRIVAALKACQETRGDGFIGGMPEADRVFGEIACGEIRSSGFDLNGCWVPWYNLHKTFAGLLDAHRHCGDLEALAIARRLADWAANVTAALDDALWQEMLACEFGGMNESLADLHGMTGEARYLRLAERFHHRAVLDPLADGIDNLSGLHGNTQIPKILGCARLYEVTGDTRYRRIVENFWRFVTEDHTYCIGGHGCGEYFGPARELADRLTHTTCETCNTYNLLKLAGHVYTWTGDGSVIDFVERALYNHILASQSPETGMVCYFVPLQPADFRSYSTPEDSFWCCVGTGWENHTRHDALIWSADGDTLRANLWIPSAVAWRDGTLALTTDFPSGDTATLTWRGPETEFALTLRGAEPLGWRAWRDGDAVTVRRAKGRAVEAMPDAPHRIALLDGPIVYAADLGPAPEDFATVGDEKPDAQIPTVPVLVGPENASPWEIVPDGVRLAPFYTLHGRRYAVYLDRFTPEGWAVAESGYRTDEARRNAERTRRIDQFWPGQMQPERDHDFSGEGSVVGERSAWKFRQAAAGGRLSFTLRALPGPLELVCKMGPEPEEIRTVTVLVDGAPIATHTVDSGRHRHLDTVLAIPEALTDGKDRITVTLSADHGTPTPALFLCEIRKRL